MKYFLHDTNSFLDDKITELYINFGYEGLGLFYTILEKIAFQEKPIKTEVLKSQLNVGKRLNKCWKFMESLGLISSNNGETFNKQLLNFSEKYQIKKEKNRKRISQWRENQQDIKNVTRYESVRNSPKVNRSKVKRNKVNKSKENKKDGSPSDLFFNELRNEWFIIYEKAKGYKYEFSGADGANLKLLIKKLKNKTLENNLEWNESNAILGFKEICRTAYGIRWLKDNFDIKNINSQFNKIYGKGKEAISKKQDAKELFDLYFKK